MAADITGFIKTHERLIIIVLVLVFGVWALGKGFNYFEQRDQQKLDILTQQLAATQAELAQAQKAATAAQADANATKQAAAQQQAANAAIISSLSAQNASLNKSIADRDKQLQQKQQSDLNATIPELSQEFMSLVPNVDLKDIKVSPDGKTVTIGQDTAGKTVAQLELVPALQQDNTDLKKINDNLTKELASEQKTLDTVTQDANAEAAYAAAEAQQIVLLNTQAAQANKVCDARVAVEKAKGRKSFLRGLKIGAIAGFIGGLFVGHGI